ncbi:DUF488 domain-containing protein [Microlunatus panaciterrae]|nr:DUF488 family protein [Microlunatus panaciterrae]
MLIMGSEARVRVGRVYDKRGPSDGRRVLVDRLWPRGLRKDDPRLDQWNRDVAPSSELRRWYGHRPDRFAEFEHRYRHELTSGEVTEAVDELRTLARLGPLTLLTATRDPSTSHAAILARVIEGSD